MYRKLEKEYYILLYTLAFSNILGFQQYTHSEDLLNELDGE